MYLPEAFSLILFLLIILLVPAWRKFYFFPNNQGEKELRKGKRIEYYDFLKGLAIFAVVIIHMAWFYAHLKPDFEYNYFFVLVNALTRFAIGVFFICSGLLLGPWEEVNGKAKFFSRKVSRIFFPYFLVMLLMGLYFKSSILGFVYMLLNGTALVPYYFVTVLLQLYLVYPLVSKYRRSKYFLSISFVISFVSTVVLGGVTIFGAWLFTNFFFFFAYGMHMRDFFLGEGKFGRKEMKFWFWVLVMYFLFVIFLPSFYYNARFFYALAVFNILYFYRRKIKKHFISFYEFLIKTGRVSLWIFLIHFQIGYFVSDIVFDYNLNFCLEYPLILIITFFSSFGLSLALSSLYNLLLRQFLIK